MNFLLSVYRPWRLVLPGIRICSGEFVFFVGPALGQNRTIVRMRSVWENYSAKPDWAWSMVERKWA